MHELVSSIHRGFKFGEIKYNLMIYNDATKIMVYFKLKMFTLDSDPSQRARAYKTLFYFLKCMFSDLVFPYVHSVLPMLDV
jgi:hypothetical protein